MWSEAPRHPKPVAADIDPISAVRRKPMDTEKLPSGSGRRELTARFSYASTLNPISSANRTCN